MEDELVKAFFKSKTGGHTLGADSKYAWNVDGSELVITEVLMVSLSVLMMRECTPLSYTLTMLNCTVMMFLIQWLLKIINLLNLVRNIGI
jgi:hypothetical protein